MKKNKFKIVELKPEKGKSKIKRTIFIKDFIPILSAVLTNFSLGAYFTKWTIEGGGIIQNFRVTLVDPIHNIY